MSRWRNSASPLVKMALPNGCLDELGVFDLTHVQTGILSQYYEGWIHQEPCTWPVRTVL